MFLTEHCAGTACAMKTVRPTTNEEGCLWTQNTVTPHQFYAVSGNKMEKLIFQLSYVYQLFSKREFQPENFTLDSNMIKAKLVLCLIA
jgi:hypothetical protein